MKRANAFTLIELLIVVAIIAILAAIAVPNFLEAQVRSKISRAQADMRSTAVALESYAVDHNKFPIGYMNIRQGATSGGPAAYNMGATARNYYALARLTTPVAYVTSIFTDPFTVGGSFIFDRVMTIRPENGYCYWYDDYMPHTEIPGFTIGPGFPYTKFRDLNNLGYQWSLSSAGPLRNTQQMWYALWGVIPANANDQIIFPYDASNGTVSEGFVGRTNKGVYTEVNTGKLGNG